MIHQADFMHVYLYIRYLEKKLNVSWRQWYFINIHFLSKRKKTFLLSDLINMIVLIFQFCPTRRLVLEKIIEIIFAFDELSK